MALTSLVGGLIASLVGGALFQFASVKVAVGVGLAACVVGAVLMVVGIRRVSATMPVADEATKSE